MIAYKTRRVGHIPGLPKSPIWSHITKWDQLHAGLPQA